MNLPESLLEALQAGPASAGDLIRLLGVSQPTLSRALQGLQREGRALKMGSTRGARYGMPRVIPGAGSAWPVFRVDATGALHDLGQLHALRPQQYYLESTLEPLRGLGDAIPYFLQDQRPAGFLGRTVPASFPELNLPARVADWTDDHYLLWLTRRGSDCVGDLIVGAEALDRYLQSLKDRQPVIAATRAQQYPRLAASVMERGQPGSSAHGEHPKFTALVDHGDRRVPVIVKFSPPVDSPVGQRWSDLLVAEHLAHVHLSAHGIAAARSQVFEGDRLYLEVERFDRAGAEGRVGVVSLLAVDAARFGMLDTWSRSALRLVNQGLLAQPDLMQVRLIEAFAMLIANTDRHFGNLALFDRHDGRLALAPVYDMLPMLFAPQHDQLVNRTFEAPDPNADTLSVWPRARALAEAYWERVMTDARISAGFRQIAARSLEVLRAVPMRAAVVQ